VRAKPFVPGQVVHIVRRKREARKIGEAIVRCTEDVDGNH